jgi:tetratricopeptide (TPR) repeat protein
MSPTIEIFCCYAREDQELLRHLKTHLMLLQRQGLITIWSDTDISAGTAWEEQIEKHLDSSHIVLLLVSADFMASDYCYSKEMQRAMQRHECGEAHVIPVLLRPILWKDAPFAKLQALPRNGKPITDRSWHTEDDALLDVAEQISTVVKVLRVQNTLEEADSLSTTQRYEEALVLYNQVTLLEPNSALAQLRKGETLLALERYEESLAAFDQAVHIDQTIANVHFYEEKALTLSKLLRFEECLTAFDEALRLDPRSVHSYTEKAQILLQLHFYSEALATYEQLTQLDPNNAEHYHYQGDILVELGRFPQALEAYEQAIRIDPKEAIYYAKLGTLLSDFNRYEEALNAYEQAIHLEPTQAEYNQKRGDLFVKLKRYEEALQSYKECMRTNPDVNPHCYHGMGQAMFGLGQYKEALAAYEQAIDRSEPHPHPQFFHEVGIVYEVLAQQAFEKEKQTRLDWKSDEDTHLSKVYAFRAEMITLLHSFTGHTNFVYGVAFSPDGQVLASGSGDKTIKLWGLSDGDVK